VSGNAVATGLRSGCHEEGAQIEILPIHFDVPGHQIPLATFVRTAEQTEAVLRALNRELFDGQLQFELFVLPPEEGTFLTRLGVVLLGGWAIVWGFTESDVGKAFIKGLTDHEPAHWAEVAGKAAKTGIEHLASSWEDRPTLDYEYETLIVKEATRAFLQQPNSVLERVGVTPSRYRDAYEAKNKFYEACSATPGLQAVGFSEAPVFPIQRDDFLGLQMTLPPRSEDLERPWYVATTLLQVTSPNWDRDDRARQWKGRDPQGRDRYFRIEDEDFWRQVAGDGISTHIIDTMKVQWAYQGKPEQPRNCRVLRVLEFNGVRLSKPVSDTELRAALGHLADVDEDNQPDLFPSHRD
jgi:hypothetical protein